MREGRASSLPVSASRTGSLTAPTVRSTRLHSRTSTSWLDTRWRVTFDVESDTEHSNLDAEATCPINGLGYFGTSDRREPHRGAKLHTAGHDSTVATRSAQ